MLVFWSFKNKTWHLKEDTLSPPIDGLYIFAKDTLEFLDKDIIKNKNN